MRNTVKDFTLWLLGAVVIWSAVAAFANAGIFRRGPILPWRHQQWDGPETPTPSQPLPPPILEPVFTGPSPEEIELKELKKKVEKQEEVAKEKAVISAADPNNKLPFELPLWLPVAAGGLGVAGASGRRVIGAIRLIKG